MKTKAPAFLILSTVLALVMLSCNLGAAVTEPAPQPAVLETAQPTSGPSPVEPASPTPAAGPAGPVETETVPTASLVPPTDTPLPAAPTATLPVETAPTVVATPAATQPETAAPDAAPTPCPEEVCSLAGAFLLSRPVAAPGRMTIDVSDRFGMYERRRRAANHGVSFLNSTGTPVLASAPGRVIAAGEDYQEVVGRFPGAYGNLVILQHSLSGFAEPVFTLYAHLSQVAVAVDQEVAAGQEIGRVGSSGSVRGSTLHFEVRFGENTYTAVRNPELWLSTLADENGQSYGALAGRVLDAQGAELSVGNIQVERLGAPGQPAVETIYLKTYAEKRLAGLGPWGESFAAGDLPAGSYQISFWLGGLQQRVVQVEPGRLTFVTFRIP